MKCPQCGVVNADDAARCSSCHSAFLEEGTISMDREADSHPTEAHTGRTPQSRAYRSSSFVSGDSLNERYSIVRPLGEGGMGEVYLAYDRELDRQVAIKLILADLTAQPTVMERFKREIALASKITHKNVLRVYDLGDAAGLKFLSMQYVEGQDLASLMKSGGRLPTERVVTIFRQLCEGLAAAHEQGVIHRDLKPQNVLVHSSGSIAIADFGLAKSFEQASLTEAGKVIGTPHYMSPEQVKGVTLDQRSDIFSLGIILYEMLTGRMPFTGASAYEVMIQRIHKTAEPATVHNAQIPPYLLRILQRCLELDLSLRYANVTEILHDLDTQTFHSTMLYRIKRRRKLGAAVAIALALLVGIGGYYGWRAAKGSHDRAAEAGHKPVGLLIADLQNRTGDAVFDGTLEPMLTLALEGASFVNAYSRVQAHKEAAQIQSNSTVLDERLARLVAGREGLNVVISGIVSKEGSQYRLALKALDAITGNAIGESNVTADTREKMLAAVSQAAADVRKALGDPESISSQLAEAETFTAGSLEAAHEYAVAQDLQFRGSFDEAVHHFEQAIKLDPKLGRAYAGLAAVYNNMGRQSDAENYYKLAMAHVDRMTDREKYRTRGSYYIVTHDNARAAEELAQLVKEFPADEAGLNNLALVYFYQRDMRRALDASQRPIALYPKDAIARNNAALYAMYAGQFETAIKQAQTVLQMNPTYVKAYVPIALSQFALNDAAAAKATYEQLATKSPRGQSIAACGLADLELFAGQNREAAKRLQDASVRDLADKRADPANRKLATAAEALASASLAAQSFQATTHDPHTLYIAAQAFLRAGRESEANAVAARLTALLEPELQHYGKLIEGEVLLHGGHARESLAKFEEAKKLADSWLARFDRGRAYLELNAFTEADTDFDACVKRRGEATAVFLDDVPTFHFFPPAVYYQGRAREGLGSASAAESYRQFLVMKDKGDGDPLVADARRRLDKVSAPAK